MPLFEAAEAGVSAVGSTSAPTTTSASYVVIPQMTVTVVTHGKSVVVVFSGQFNVQTNDDWTIGIHEDGVLVAASECRNSFFGGSLLGLTPANEVAVNANSVAFRVNPTAGSHTYDCRWKVAAGTARAILTMRQIVVYEVG